MLSNKAKKAAEDANQPVESLCCCCGRSWATSASVVALSFVILILVICLCNTFIGLLLTASGSSGNLRDAKFIWLDLPIIFTVAASLASIAAYRFMGKGLGLCFGLVAFVCAVGVIGICAFIGIYWILASGTMYMGFGTGYILIAFLLVTGGITLAICVGLHTCQSCCCCKRPDEAPAAANSTNTMEMGGINVVVNVPDPTNGVVTVKATMVN